MEMNTLEGDSEVFSVKDHSQGSWVIDQPLQHEFG